MTLTKNYICESCHKSGIKQLEWNKILRNWLCFSCQEKWLKEEKRLRKA